MRRGKRSQRRYKRERYWICKGCGIKAEKRYANDVRKTRTNYPFGRKSKGFSYAVCKACGVIQ